MLLTLSYNGISTLYSHPTMLQTSFCFLHLNQLRSDRLGKHLICISLGLCFNHLNVSFRLCLNLISLRLSQSGLLIQLCNLCVLLCLLLCANLLHQGIIRLCIHNQSRGNIDSILCGQLLIQIVGDCSIHTCSIIGINLHDTELRSNFLDVSNNIVLNLALHQALTVHTTKLGVQFNNMLRQEVIIDSQVDCNRTAISRGINVPICVFLYAIVGRSIRKYHSLLSNRELRHMLQWTHEMPALRNSLLLNTLCRINNTNIASMYSLGTKHRTDCNEECNENCHKFLRKYLLNLYS